MAGTAPEISVDDYPLALLVAGEDGVIATANVWAREMFAGQLVGGKVNAIFPEEPDAHGTLLDAALVQRDRVRLHGRRLNGVPFTANAVAKLSATGELVFTLRELHGTELVDSSAQLFHAAFDNAPIGMALYNTDGEFVRVNDSLCRLLGQPPESLIGRRDQELTHPDDRQADIDAAWRILRGELDRWQTEKRFVRPDGEVVWAIANMTFLRDERGRPLSWLGQFQDISDRKRAEQQLREIAEHDDLTGVANRRRLTRELAARVLHASRYEECGAVLVLDLDGFKAINDTLGHGAGDAILIDVATALGHRLRSTDTLGRLGGDEFAVILPHATIDAAVSVAHVLVAAVQEASRGAVTASCGVAVYGPGAELGPECVLRLADLAMYDAKKAGRNTVAVSAADAATRAAS